MQPKALKKKNPWNLALGVRQFMPPSSFRSSCAGWEQVYAGNTPGVSHLIEDVNVKSVPRLRAKECLVCGTLSLPEVLRDNLSFVFQAL